MPAQTFNPQQNSDGVKSLADILLAQGSLTSERAQQIKMAEVQSGKSQEEIIVGQNIVPKEALAKAKAVLYNIPFVDLSTLPTNPEALTVLPLDVAEKFKVYPTGIEKSAKILYLAMSDPLDLSAIEFIEKKTGLRVKPQAAESTQVDEFLSTRYSTTLSQEVTEALKEVEPEEKEKTFDIAGTGFIKEEKIAEIVSQILDFAMRARASDVHIEPQEKITRVRSVSYTHLTLPTKRIV